MAPSHDLAVERPVVPDEDDGKAVLGLADAEGPVGHVEVFAAGQPLVDLLGDVAALGDGHLAGVTGREVGHPQRLGVLAARAEAQQSPERDLLT